jgi:hypothetical protein
MKLTNGNILVITGIMHALFAVLPIAFGKQFLVFSEHYFFKVSSGLSEFPLLNGQMMYENFAAFWFFYFGILIIPIGILVRHLGLKEISIPLNFIIVYLIVVLIGVYMIPFSGRTIFMLPHAIFMLWSHLKYH